MSYPLSKRRVVVTGLGLVTPWGVGTQKSWEGALAGLSGIRRISHFDPTDFASQVAGEVPDFDADAILSSKDQKKMDRFIQLGLQAGDEAMQMAGLNPEEMTEEERQKASVFLGSGVGGLPEIEATAAVLSERGPRRVSPFFIPAVLTNLLAGQASMRYRFEGPNFCPVSACASGSHAIGYALRSIQSGESNIVLAGGAEACVCGSAVAGFAAARALSTGFNATPQKASRPFDAQRDGFVIAEGAGVLVLEELEHAKARGANILAELKGFGQTSDAYHMTSPREDGAGVKRAMQQAVADAGLTPEDVQYVNPHATSTPAGDVTESKAIEDVFGKNIVLSATKSMIGHSLGAAGAIEAALCVLSVKNQKIHPTINLENLSEGCDLDYVREGARSMQLKNVVSNSFGFGGTNATLLFSSHDENF